MLTDEDIFNRYRIKQAEFAKQADVTLIGHSLFDMWSDISGGTPLLAGKTVANLGISGVSARQYLDVVVKPGYITQLGQHVFIFLGVNDIVKEPDYSPAQVLAWLNEMIAHFRRIAPNSRYYLLEATPVNQIETVDNPAILVLNRELEAHCPPDVRYVKTWHAFANQEGKLDLRLCHDGLHFTPQGYAQLEEILVGQLSS